MAALDGAVAALVLVLCIFNATVMMRWSWVMRRSRSDMYPLMLSSAVSKIGITVMISTILYMVVQEDIEHPTHFLPGLLVILLACVIQAVMIFRLTTLRRM